jgi:hypothetical protein
MLNFIGYLFAVVVAGAIVWSLNKVVRTDNALSLIQMITMTLTLLTGGMILLLKKRYKTIFDYTPCVIRQKVFQLMFIVFASVTILGLIQKWPQIRSIFP